MTDAGPSVRQRFLGPVERALPPVRLLLIALAILGGVSCYTLGGLGLSSLLFLPLVAGAVDLLFQSVRFERLRVPETAFASSLILALLLPPTVPLGPAAAIAVAAVGIRHAIRRRGRPVFNPAAAGALLGALVFATAPAWWASVSQTQELLLVALGIIVVLRAPGTWRSIAVFFPLYVVIVSLLHASTGASVSARVLLLGAIDPSVAFFGFFMVAEPRTGPRDPDQRIDLCRCHRGGRQHPPPVHAQSRDPGRSPRHEPGRGPPSRRSVPRRRAEGVDRPEAHSETRSNRRRPVAGLSTGRGGPPRSDPGRGDRGVPANPPQPPSGPPGNIGSPTFGRRRLHGRCGRQLRPGQSVDPGEHSVDAAQPAWPVDDPAL